MSIINDDATRPLLGAAPPKPTWSQLVEMGHPDECARRIVVGDGRCTCGLDSAAQPKPAPDVSCGHCGRGKDCAKTANPADCVLNTNRCALLAPQPGEVEEAVKRVKNEVSVMESCGKRGDDYAKLTTLDDLRTVLTALADLQARLSCEIERRALAEGAVDTLKKGVADLQAQVAAKDAELARLLASHPKLDKEAAELQAAIGEMG